MFPTKKETSRDESNSKHIYLLQEVHLIHMGADNELMLLEFLIYHDN